MSRVAVFHEELSHPPREPVVLEVVSVAVVVASVCAAITIERRMGAEPVAVPVRADESD